MPLAVIYDRGAQVMPRAVVATKTQRDHQTQKYTEYIAKVTICIVLGATQRFFAMDLSASPNERVHFEKHQ